MHMYFLGLYYRKQKWNLKEIATIGKVRVQCLKKENLSVIITNVKLSYLHLKFSIFCCAFSHFFFDAKFFKIYDRSYQRA